MCVSLRSSKHSLCIDTVRLVLIQRLSTGPSGVDEPREVCLFQSTGKNVSWTSGNGSWRKRNTRLTLVDQELRRCRALDTPVSIYMSSMAASSQAHQRAT
uniref:Uncharacterized protein n=1 Tax=Timema douglasi TaxID=61478 RepID=A0A7R8VY92_TIMDO|nr:unnamed protein product [Timema douglasi]